jgi:hypothetical protein
MEDYKSLNESVGTDVGAHQKQILLPEYRLCAKMLCSAVADYHCADSLRKKDAEVYLFDEDGDHGDVANFAWVCSVLKLNFKKVQAVLGNKLTKTGIKIANEGLDSTEKAFKFVSLIREDCNGNKTQLTCRRQRKKKEE